MRIAPGTLMGLPRSIRNASRSHILGFVDSFPNFRHGRPNLPGGTMPLWKAGALGLPVARAAMLVPELEAAVMIEPALVQ